MCGNRRRNIDESAIAAIEGREDMADTVVVAPHDPNLVVARCANVVLPGIVGVGGDAAIDSNVRDRAMRIGSEGEHRSEAK